MCGGWWGFEDKRAECKNEWEHKAKEGKIGIHEAELIDCNMIDRLKTGTGWRASMWGSN